MSKYDIALLVLIVLLAIGFMYNKGLSYRKSLNGKKFKWNLPIRISSIIVVSVICPLCILGLKTILEMGIRIYQYKYISISSSVLLPAIINIAAFLIGIFIITMAGIFIFINISLYIGSLFMFIITPDCAEETKTNATTSDEEDEWKDI